MERIDIETASPVVLEYIDARNIVAIDYNADGSITLSDNLPAPGQWEQIEADDLKYTEKPEDTDSGMVYQQELKCTFSRNALPQAKKFRELQTIPIVVKMYYTNDTILIIGLPDSPARLTVEVDSVDYNFLRSITIAANIPIPTPMLG